MNVAAALVALVAMSGCVTTGLVPTKVWTKGGVDQAQLRHDEYECNRDAALFFSNVAGHGPITAVAGQTGRDQALPALHGVEGLPGGQGLSAVG
jgi:hypothetical protein